MTAELEPYRFQATSEVASLGSFIVPSRNLTPAERAVYDKAKWDFARLTADARTRVYAMGLAGEVIEFMVQAASTTTTRVLGIVDGLEDPRARDLMEPFAVRSIMTHQQILAGLNMSGAQRQQAIVQELYPEPVEREPNFWDRLLGRA